MAAGKLLGFGRESRDLLDKGSINQHQFFGIKYSLLGNDVLITPGLTLLPLRIIAAEIGNTLSNIYKNQSCPLNHNHYT